MEDEIALKPYSPTLILFLSGLSSLGFQTLWLRGFSQTVGSTSSAYSIVIGLFLLGLAIGSFMAAFMNKRIETFTSRPLLSFGVLELIGSFISCLSVYLLFYHPALIFSLLRFFENGLFAKIMTVAIFLIPPTILFGAGLPIMATEKRVNFDLDRLYAANTFGGACGCILFGLILPYYTSFFISSLFALTLTISIFLYCLVKEKILKLNRVNLDSFYEDLDKKSLLLACLSGFFFLTLEIISERILGLILGDRSYVGAIILTLILIIISLGALSVKVIKNHSKLFTTSVILGFIALYVVYFLKDSALHVVRGHQYLSQPKVTFIVFGLLPLIYAMSLIFPTCLTSIKDKNPTAETGLYLGGNTICALLASMLTSHLLFSAIGLNGILSLTALSFIIIGLLTLRGSKKALTLLGLPLMIIFAQSKLSITSPENLIIQEESAETHFSIITRNGKEEIYGGNDRLIAPWKRKNIAHAQEALAFFPALYSNKSEEILMVGLGYGITTNAFIKLAPKNVEVLEIIPQLVKYTHRYKELNNSWQKNPVVNLVLNDGLQHLSVTNKTYDIISISIDNPYTSSAGYALTTEFYQIVASKLNEGGIFSQMIWGPHLPEIIATLRGVFPYLKLLPAYSDQDFIVVASTTPLQENNKKISFENIWSPYLEQDRSRSLEENISMGTKILKKIQKQEHEFIISKHSPKMEFDQREELGFLWVRK